MTWEDIKKPVFSRLWFMRIKLSHLWYGQWSSTSKEEDWEVPNLISCSELVLQPHSPLKFLVFITTQESFVKKAELAENCLQIQAVLAFSVKSTVFMRYHGLFTCILFFPENEQYKYLKFKEQFHTIPWPQIYP